MANTLTGLIPTLYEALNTVQREMVGFIPAVRSDSDATRAALDETVRVPIGAAGELEDITPGMQPADSGDTTVDYTDIKITKSKAAPVKWNGEEQVAVGNSGQYNAILANQFTDAMRKLVNALEIDIAAAAVAGASRAYGTAGSTPFGTAGDLSDFAGVAQILDENGAPTTDRQLVVNSAALANIRGKQSVLFKVNEAGSNDMLRNGMTDRIQNFALRQSAGLVSHAVGNAADYVTSGSSGTGLTRLAMQTGTGSFNVGDVVTIGGYQYVVGVASDGSTLVLNKPGLKGTVADSTAITLGAAYTPSVAFDRNAVVLAARAPAVPQGGDSADDAMMITDPVSGLSFEVRVYRMYRQVKYEVCLAWGVAAIKPENIALLLG